MFLSKSTSGIYQLYFYNDEGKRKKISTRCNHKSDAVKFLQRFNPEIRNIKIRWEDYRKKYLEFAKINVTPRTLLGYEYAIKYFQEVAGNIPLDKITPQHWDNYKIFRLNKNIQPTTVNIELRYLKAILFVAKRWKYIDQNPFSLLKLCSVPEKNPSFFSKEDFQILLNMIKENWLKEIVLFATLTGLRRNEIVNLCWNNVNFRQKTISIENSEYFKTKSRKNRVLPLSESALLILKLREKQLMNEFVFTLNGNKIKASWLTHKFKYWVYECRFKNDELHFHSLRHTFASWLVQDGVSLFEVQKLLGHSDSKTTMIYSHLQPEMLHSAVNKIQISLN